MLEFAQIYIRSIIGIGTMSAVIAYLGLVDPIVVGGYMAAVVACVLLDKGEE